MATIKDSLNGLIEVKLGASLTGPTKRLVADLHEAARRCNQARNGMANVWWHWRWSNPDWQPAQRTTRGTPKVDAAGEPVLEDACYSQECEAQMYRFGCDASAPLAAQIVASLRNEVVQNLKAKLPYNRPDKALKKRWEAVLAHLDRLPLWTTSKIPLPTSCTALAYAGRLAAGKGVPKERSAAGGGTVADLARVGAHRCVLRLALFTAASGRRFAAPMVCLETRQMPDGQRAVLKKIASGQWKLRDSWLVFKRGAWYAQLVYRQPTKALGLDPKTVAVLWATPLGSDRPFLLEIDAERRWNCGRGRDLADAYRRVEARRLALRNRYHDATSGVKGHGRERFELRVRPYGRVTQDAQSLFCWELIREIRRFCQRHDCGTVVYREPNLVLREHSWFARGGVPFDWTGLLNKLSFKLESYGIVLQVVACSAADWRNRFDEEGSRVPQTQGRNGAAARAGGRGRYQGVQKPGVLAGGGGNPANQGPPEGGGRNGSGE